MKFQPFMYKWKRFSFEFNNYSIEKQRGLVGTVDFVMKKHFAHRIYDRFASCEHTTIRKIMYHTVNKHLAEVLFWFYSDIDKDLAIRRHDIIMIMERGQSAILVTTIYRLENDPPVDKFFLIDIGKKRNDSD